MNNGANNPVCTIIAGPNGAGKTTFALRYLPQVAHYKRFVNADLIAAGLSPLAPEAEWMAASRTFLAEIKQATKRRKNFAFETTLSGKSYLHLIRQLKAEEWQIQLFYLWLPDVSMSIERVRERVKHGGHNISEDSIRRRFPCSLRNLMRYYMPLCDVTVCLNNSAPVPQGIFNDSKYGLEIHDKSIYESLEKLK